MNAATKRGRHLNVRPFWVSSKHYAQMIMASLYSCFTKSETVLLTQDCATNTQCLKIMEKVAFNIASEASYVYILSGQNYMKNAKNGQFGRIFEKCDFLRNFQTLCNISLSRLVGTWTGSRPTFYGKALYNTHPIRQKALEEVGSNPA